MAYNTKKGTQHTGDIQFEGDPLETQIDFENDSITLKTGGEARLVTNNSHISASVNISGSNFYGSSGEFVTLKASSIIGGSPLDISASSVTITGSITLSGSGIMSASSGHFTSVSASSATISALTASAISGGSPITISGDTITLIGPVTANGNLSVQGNSTLGNASGDSITLNGATIDIPNVAAGTDNTVVVYNGNTLVTDEIGPKVWAGKLVDYSGTPATNQVTTWSGGDTTAGSSALTFDGSALRVVGALSASIASNPVAAFTHTANNSVGGILELINSRNGNAGQADDFCGGLAFKSRDSTSTPTQYSKITTKIGSPTNTSESGYMIFEVTTSGTVGAEYFRLDGRTNAITASKDTLVNANLQVSNHVAIGESNLANAALYVKAHSDNSVVATFKSPSNDTIMAITGSGRVAIGGVYVDGILNISGSDNDKLITAKSNTANPAFYISGSGDAFFSGNVGIGTLTPAYDLHVNGPGVTVATIDGGTSSDAYLKFATGGLEKSFIKLGSGGNLIVANDATGGDLILQAKPGGAQTEFLRLDSSLSALTASVPTQLSGNATIKTISPHLHFSSSVHDAATAHIGLNIGHNLLIQNNMLNQHIVFKANDGGNIKEGLRLNGQVPEVVVNEGADSLTNFRVESNNNQYMLYVSGATNQVGIGVSDPAIGVTLDISGSAMRLRNSSTPASAGAPGVPGEIRWDANYVYICVGIDAWKRAAIAAW
tara:strand:- start:501 stop:2663 length:2163 start_codon:yes stop_codon:yes gene_type:complete